LLRFFAKKCRIYWVTDIFCCLGVCDEVLKCVLWIE
jgi:hypothetical protein